jgi:2-polyprenyl-3-methyl-5-hydroxy-6-metoxy-1,4-benzoquinol methylase
MVSNIPTTEFRDYYHALVREDVTPFVPKLGGTLLDVGGGIGATASYLKRHGHADRVGVIDMVAPAPGERLTDFNYQGDIEDAAFIADVIDGEGPFNIILCLDILEHLVDPWRLVAQLHMALAPGGAIVASIPNIRNYKALVPLVLRNRWDLADSGILDRTHLRFFVRSTAIEMMTRSGLRLESVNPSVSGGRKVALFRKLTFGLFDSFTDRQYVVCVRNA